MWGIKETKMKPFVDLRHIYNIKRPTVAEIAIFRPSMATLATYKYQNLKMDQAGRNVTGPSVPINYLFLICASRFYNS